VNVYFISGLAADKRIFKRLRLSPKFTVHHVDWIKPLPKESIGSYAKRLSILINKEEPFVLIGLSFGGMVAIEMNRFVEPVRTIVISSAATKKQLPWYVRAIKFMPLYKLIPDSFMRKANPILNWLFGAKTQDEKSLLKELLADSDISILKWSIDAVAKWSNETIPVHLVHIHGDADKVLPINWMKPHKIIKGGEHLMVYSKADEISEVLNELLDQTG
jgi:pimeloyl-ACP methyl ester carboxylesterase